jgi:hypothetical protein
MAHTRKYNRTGKWDYMGKAYIVQVMEETGTKYKILG